MKPTIEVRRDYDNYFAGLVRQWIDEKHAAGEPFRHELVTVEAGPYRPYAVSTEQDGTTLHLDFYSALRTGFGQLSGKDIEAIKELL